MQYKMSELSPEEKARWANHLKTKRKMSRYPENIFTPTIFRAKNPPETSRSGRPCQCCRQGKFAEKVFLNDNLRMIFWRKEQKKTMKKKKKGKRTLGMTSWIEERRNRESDFLKKKKIKEKELREWLLEEEKKKVMRIISWIWKERKIVTRMIEVKGTLSESRPKVIAISWNCRWGWKREFIFIKYNKEVGTTRSSR